MAGSSATTAFSCNFTYASFALAAVYAVILVFVIRYYSKLFGYHTHKKQSQKVFLALVILQCLCRLGYFSAYPFLRVSSNCSPGLKNREFDVISLFGNLPAALFFSAYSTLVYSFARIYHRVLCSTSRSHFYYFNFLLIILLSLNTLVFVSELGEWATAGTNTPFFADFLPYLASGASFCLACTFFIYGAFLYVKVKHLTRISHTYQAAHTPIMATSRLPSHHHHHNNSVKNVMTPSAPSPHSNPNNIRPSGHVQGHSHSQSHSHSNSLDAEPLSMSLQSHVHTHVHSDAPAADSSPIAIDPILSTTSHSTIRAHPSPRSAYLHINQLRVHHTNNITNNNRVGAIVSSDHPNTSNETPPSSSSLSSPFTNVPTIDSNSKNNNSLHVPLLIGSSGSSSSQSPTSAFSSSSSSSSSSISTSTSSASGSDASNPMRKIAIIAGICTLCLLARTIMLAIMAVLNLDFDAVTTLLYFMLAECIPLSLMLRVFDTSPISSTSRRSRDNENGHTKDTQEPNLSMQSTPISTHHILYQQHPQVHVQATQSTHVTTNTHHLSYANETSLLSNSRVGEHDNVFNDSHVSASEVYGPSDMLSESDDEDNQVFSPNDIDDHDISPRKSRGYSSEYLDKYKNLKVDTVQAGNLRRSLLKRQR